MVAITGLPGLDSQRLPWFSWFFPSTKTFVQKYVVGLMVYVVQFGCCQHRY